VRPFGLTGAPPEFCVPKVKVKDGSGAAVVADALGGQAPVGVAAAGWEILRARGGLKATTGLAVCGGGDVDPRPRRLLSESTDGTGCWGHALHPGELSASAFEEP
jgi:hypothetical protein